MPRIIVMSEPSTERRERAITLDERVASADLQGGDESAQLVGRVGAARRGYSGLITRRSRVQLR
jgi:hypothetical protein